MQSTPVKETRLEVLSSGTLDDMMALPDSIVRHGDNVYMEISWQDQSMLPEVVAAELEPRLRAAGCVPADGETRMVVPDPDFLRISVNYREQTPEFGMIAAIIGGIGLIAAGAMATVFRAPVEQQFGAQTNTVLIGLAVVSGLILGGGLFFAFAGPQGQRRLRS